MPATGVSNLATRRRHRRRTAVVAAAVVVSTALGACAQQSDVADVVEPSKDQSVESGQPVPTVAAPAEGPGDLAVVSVPPQATLEPVSVDDPALVADEFRLDVQLGRAEEVSSGRPGEIGGEALTVTVQITNEGSTSRDVSTVFVTVEDVDGNPLSPLYGDPYVPVTGDLEPAGSTEGTYVFSLTDVTQPYTVRVSAAAEDPVAVFLGSL